MNLKYKFPLILMALYVSFLLLTVSLANRFFEIYSIAEPGGIFIFPLTFIILDVVSEVYGYAYSRLFIWVGALCEILFSTLAVIVSHLPAPEYFNLVSEYQSVFDPTIRFVMATLVGTLIGEFANIYFLSKWKIRLRGNSFILRAIIATGVGQLILSIIVDIMAFSGKINFKELILLIFNGYTWKMISFVIFVFPAWTIAKKLKKVECIDHYDVNVNFNPFKFNLDGGINKHSGVAF